MKSESIYQFYKRHESDFWRYSRFHIYNAEEITKGAKPGALSNLKALCAGDEKLMVEVLQYVLRMPFVIGFLKGKSAVRIHRNLLGNKRVVGLHFWSRGYCVSTLNWMKQAEEIHP